MKKKNNYFRIIPFDGTSERYISPIMPQIERANMHSYKQGEKQIKLFSQIHSLTAFSHSGLTTQ